MISLSYNVRISLRQDYSPLPFLFGFNARPTTDFRDYTSPIVEHGISFENLSERVVIPFNGSRGVSLDGHTIPFGAIERIEIRAEGVDKNSVSPLHEILAKLRPFESIGADVSAEFIVNLSQWGPSVGPLERPEAIPIDLLFDRLVTNERLREATRSRFQSRNFTDAVEAAFKCLDNAVKEKSGFLDKDGQDLMFRVFSEQSPVLRLNALSSTTELNEQEGYRHLFAGSMKGIRNPRAHEYEMKDDPTVALELLILANHLMRKLDGATKSDTQSAEPGR